LFIAQVENERHQQLHKKFTFWEELGYYLPSCELFQLCQWVDKQTVDKVYWNLASIISP